MKAFIIDGPRDASVVEVEAPTALVGHAVVSVERAGVCGTDTASYLGELPYLHDGHARFPLRIGHEWMGTVIDIGADVDRAWLGRRVVGDTMMGCGECSFCLSGRHYVCETRFEVGVRNGWPGALAEQVLMPAAALYRLPESVDAAMGALVEPGATALRAVKAAQLFPGSRILVIGPGTIGLLVVQFALAHDAEVHVRTEPGDVRGQKMAMDLGVHGIWEAPELPTIQFDAAVDATSDASVPQSSIEMVEPARRVVLVGVSGTPSLVDSRSLVMKDATAIGILGGSLALQETIQYFATGKVDPRPLIAATVSLEAVSDILEGHRPASAGPGPKFHVDPNAAA